MGVPWIGLISAVVCANRFVPKADTVKCHAVSVVGNGKAMRTCRLKRIRKELREIESLLHG
jgi:predicted ABC-type sugar transport system permease subunit